jgi:hypothetical protein
MLDLDLRLSTTSKRSNWSSFRSGDEVASLPHYESFCSNALTALDLQLKARNNIEKLQHHQVHAHDASLKKSLTNKPCTGMSLRWKQQIFKRQKYLKELKTAKGDAEMIILGMCALRHEGDRRYTAVPDQDRAILNEAIHAQFDPRFIKLLLEGNTRACESGGIVDHVNHPIHLACRTHHRAVSVILEAHPDCASQRDQNGKLPLEIFLDQNSTRTCTGTTSNDIFQEELTKTINLFSSLDLDSTKEDLSTGVSLKSINLGSRRPN